MCAEPVTVAAASCPPSDYQSPTVHVGLGALAFRLWEIKKHNSQAKSVFLLEIGALEGLPGRRCRRARPVIGRGRDGRPLGGPGRRCRAGLGLIRQN